jgi:hypothetical protein
MKSVTIGSLTAERGSKVRGFLEVVKRGDGSPVGLPLTIVNGVEEGPVLVADACHHGNEYEGAEVILKTVRDLNPKSLKGTFIAVHAVNIPGMLAGTRENPEDWDPGHMDFNRVYPGRSDGCMTERIAYTYLHEVVAKADCVMSFHGGGDKWYVGPLATYDPPASSEAAKKAAEYALATGMELMDEGSPEDPIKGTLMNAGSKIGIPVVTPELGGHCDRYRNRENLVGLGFKALTNVMKHLGMVEGRPELPNKQIVALDVGYTHCRNGGLQFPKAKSLDRVKKGDVLTTIVNPWTGEEIERIESPRDGIISMVLAQPMAKPGDWAFGVSKILREVTN